MLHCQILLALRSERFAPRTLRGIHMTTQQLLDAYLGARSLYTDALLSQNDQQDRRSGAMGYGADVDSHNEASVDVAGPANNMNAALTALRQDLRSRNATAALTALDAYVAANTTKTGPPALRALRSAVAAL